MAAIGNSCFWLVDFKKSSLKPLGQMTRNLVGSTYGRFCIKFPARIKLLYRTGKEHFFKRNLTLNNSGQFYINFILI
jgi:hypothetical protein